MSEPQKALAALREPFPADQVGKLPKAGTTLDYVGHGAVTARLLDVDPEWNWEPLALDERGLPVFERDPQGRPTALWIRLTVGGVTRLGVGTCQANQFEAEKVLIGDALRNAAMRFGVALDLWVHAEDDEKQTAQAVTRSERPTCAKCGGVLTGKAKPTDGGYVHEECPLGDEEPF